ncbi:MAG: hypothetical protein ACQGVK_24690 [Myxococcota bacterium]
MDSIVRALSWGRNPLVALGALSLLGAWVATAPGTALAAPEVFGFDSGSASLTAELGGIRLNDEAAIAPLSGDFVALELEPASGGPALVDFAFDLEATTIAFDAPIGDVTALVLESTTIQPVDGLYVSPPGSDLGGGEVAVGGGPVEFLVDYHFETAGGPTSSVSATLVSPGITANADVDGGTLSLLGASLAVIMPGKDVKAPLVLKADLVFRGLTPKDPSDVIPEPTGALALSAGLLVSAQAIRRRRVQTTRQLG